MVFTHDRQSFLKDGQRIFLNSGEMQYFRIPREHWAKHLEKIKAAGLNAVCSYIPWDWHEEEEGVFDFSGETHPQKDLLGWLDLCRSYNLLVILKPGPVILAEYRGAGIPFWFIENHGANCRVKNSKGELAQSDAMTFLHPVYLKYVRRWYDRILPLIAERQVTRGGQVAMVQVCNEVGVFTWLAHQADYSSYCLERYRLFLKEKYASLDKLNDVYGEQNKDWDLIAPPSDTELLSRSKTELAKDYDWHMFWRRYYGDYLRLLMQEMIQRGIDVPFYHNLPGWIYGSGWEFSLNITMYSDLYDKSYPQMIFGVDHIPEYLSYRNAHDDRVINDVVKAMQGGGPLFAAEFQAGSREYHVVTTPREMALFYKASIAHGLVGWNYYMFCQGKNPEGKGFSGRTFYWFTPLDVHGEEGTLYPTVCDTSALVKTMEPIILESKRKADVAVLFYEPHYATELEKPMDAAGCELRLQASKLRRPAYFDGVLKAFHQINVDFDILDAQRCSLADMKAYRQVWVLSTEVMDEAVQSKLLSYIKAGGYAVIYPTYPELGLDFKPCSVLKEGLGIKDSHWATMDSPLIQMEAHRDIKCHNPLRVFKNVSEKNVVATVQGQPCVVEYKLQKGHALLLGCVLSYEIEDHRVVYEDLVARSGARLRWAKPSGQRVLVQQRFAQDAGLLFVGNYYNEEAPVTVTYTHPVTEAKVSWPYALDAVVLPQTYGVLTPLCYPLTKGLSLLHTTSDLLMISEKNGVWRFVVKGDRDLPGEMVFEGEYAGQFKLINAAGNPVSLQEKQGRFFIHYTHPHQESMEFSFTLSSATVR